MHNAQCRMHNAQCTISQNFSQILRRYQEEIGSRVMRLPIVIIVLFSELLLSVDCGLFGGEVGDELCVGSEA